MKKSKLKSFLCVFAIFLILFTFLSVSASASGLSNAIDSISFDAPVSFNFYYSFYDPDQEDINLVYPRLFYSYTPVLSTNVTHESDGTPYIKDTSIIVGDYPFNIVFWYTPRSHGADLYDVFKVDLNGPTITTTEYTESLQLTDFYFTIEDFYCWNHDFDRNQIDLPPQGSEVTFIYNNNEPDYFIESYRIQYSVVGSDEIRELTVSRDDGTTWGENLQNGSVNISPYMFDSSEIDVVYYIREVKFFFNTFPSSPWGLDWVNNFIVSYINNPFLDNLILDNGTDPVPPSDNPALALIPYTVWLGNAVSGFMDFQLFSGFTIGGIFMTILAFACVVWFLKLVAGG